MQGLKRMPQEVRRGNWNRVYPEHALNDIHNTNLNVICALLDKTTS